MSKSALTRLSIKNFTAFRELDMEFSPGVNIFIGANSTGKTHLLKLMYSACVLPERKGTWQQLLEGVFSPYRGEIGRLVRRSARVAKLALWSTISEIGEHFESRRTEPMISRPVEPSALWYDTDMKCVYIPCKEVLQHSAGFLALQEKRETSFEDTYSDIILNAQLPPLKPEFLTGVTDMLQELEKYIEGTIVQRGETYFRKQGKWELEFSVLAEGYCKLGLLWLLIRNGAIAPDSIVFWDEPEANLNPKMIGVVVQTLLRLQRLGVQVFLATHDYVVLKEFQLRSEASDKVRYFSLHPQKETGDIVCDTCDDAKAVEPNLILDTFVSLYDRDMERALTSEDAL
jgi:hypothetical protein